MAGGPGKSFRKGITLLEFVEMFPDDVAAEEWFIKTRWPNGIACPRCGSLNVQRVANRKPQPLYCRDCRKYFSVKTDTVMQSSNLGCRKWLLAFYLLVTGLKGTASMKLHRDLGVTQKTAWHLAHRIRETWRGNAEPPFGGPVETDASYFGGKERNKHAKKKLRERHREGKRAVVGVKDRATGQIRANVLPDETAAMLQGFVGLTSEDGVKVYTDEAAAYESMPNRESVNHKVGEYVDGQAHTNGLESFWSMMKRGYHGTYHKMSTWHLDRYVQEFSGRHNQRPMDTLDQMESMVRWSEGKRLRYRDLVADSPNPRRRVGRKPAA